MALINGLLCFTITSSYKTTILYLLLYAGGGINSIFREDVWMLSVVHVRTDLISSTCTNRFSVYQSESCYTSNFKNSRMTVATTVTATILSHYLLSRFLKAHHYHSDPKLHQYDCAECILQTTNNPSNSLQSHNITCRCEKNV